MINSALKGIEALVSTEILAIRDDMTLMGDPVDIFGPGKAMESSLALLAKADLEPKIDAMGDAPA